MGSFGILLLVVLSAESSIGVTHGCEFNASGLGYFGVGALAGVVGTGLSSGISASMAGGSFWSGAIGATNASATGFLAGAASGACPVLLVALLQRLAIPGSKEEDVCIGILSVKTSVIGNLSVISTR